MTRYLTRALISALLFILTGPYYAARAQQPDNLPQIIAGIPFKGAKKFEDPRLGLGVTYENEGASLTLFIYNAGQREIPTGIDGSILREQFEQSKGDLQEAVRQKMLDKAVLEREGVAHLGSHEPTVPAREAVFELKKGDNEFKSYLYITAGNNFLFKVRYTVPKAGEQLKGPSPEMISREVGDLISSWLHR